MEKQRFFSRLASALAFVALFGAMASVAAGQKPRGWDPRIDPANFVAVVDNPYFPLPPGRTLRYLRQGGDERLTVEVMGQTKTVMGIPATVVRETATVAGQVVEISENWYAQDRSGNVWYFGEARQDYANGVPTGTTGSWEAGKDGAVPGFVMKGAPRYGDTYFQEYAPGIAEDMASVLSIGDREAVPLGTYANVLRTREWTALAVTSLEHKSYVPGVGMIAEESQGRRWELVAMQ